MIAKDKIRALLKATIDAALSEGCDAAEVVYYEGDGISAAVRLGKLEHIERPAEAALGLRTYFGKRQASLSTSDLSPKTLESLAAKAAAIARATPEDPYCGLADPELLYRSGPDLDIHDNAAPDGEALKELALRAENAALEVKGITNSEGASAGWQKYTRTHLTSADFAGRYSGSNYSVSAVAIAGTGTGMERDYDYSTVRHFGDLEAPEQIGKSAAARALKRLNPKKLKSRKLPIIFDKRAAASLLGHLAGAINGRQVARGTTFLATQMGNKIFPEHVRIVDDPSRKRGLASRPFDGEGVAMKALDLVRDGVLEEWLLDSASAREMGLVTNGRASRSLAGTTAPGVSNLYMENGIRSLEALLKDVGEALLVTELIGMGVNGVTGDYSRGASGFFIAGGEIAYPVNEVTIAGNLKDMFLHLTPASDLEFKRAVNAPSMLIEGMTVAGT